MNFEPTRKRREVAPFTINLLRLVGWRFSFTRAAWVFRIRKGRHGPVFVVRDDVTRPAAVTDQTGFAVVTVAESAVADAEAAVSAAAAAVTRREEPVAPLPRRTPGSKASTPSVASPSPVTAEHTEPASASDEDPATTPSHWKVDGRPTMPRPRVNPAELRSVPSTVKRASA
jgi:hypothetical protein